MPPAAKVLESSARKRILDLVTPQLDDQQFGALHLTCASFSIAFMYYLTWCKVLTQWTDGNVFSNGLNNLNLPRIIGATKNL